MPAMHPLVVSVTRSSGAEGGRGSRALANSLLVLAAALGLGYPLHAGATPIAVSYFDVGDEGWSGYGTGDSGGDFQHWSTGGNPGGHFNCLTREALEHCEFIAPPLFLGDLGAAVGGAVTFDLNERWFGSGEPVPATLGIDLHGPTTDLAIRIQFTSLGFDSWNSYAIPITPAAGWRRSGSPATLADIQAVLANVVEFNIVGNANGGFYDGARLDNVAIHPVPEPSTAALLACGLIGLGWRRRRGARA
jgi:hypothetical protein